MDDKKRNWFLEKETQSHGEFDTATLLLAPPPSFSSSSRLHISTVKNTIGFLNLMDRESFSLNSQKNLGRKRKKKKKKTTCCVRSYLNFLGYSIPFRPTNPSIHPSFLPRLCVCVCVFYIIGLRVRQRSTRNNNNNNDNSAVITQWNEQVKNDPFECGQWDCRSVLWGLLAIEKSDDDEDRWEIFVFFHLDAIINFPHTNFRNKILKSRSKSKLNSTILEKVSLFFFF